PRTGISFRLLFPESSCRPPARGCDRSSGTTIRVAWKFNYRTPVRHPRIRRVRRRAPAAAETPPASQRLDLAVRPGAPSCERAVPPDPPGAPSEPQPRKGEDVQCEEPEERQQRKPAARVDAEGRVTIREAEVHARAVGRQERCHRVPSAREAAEPRGVGVSCGEAVVKAREAEAADRPAA